MYLRRLEIDNLKLIRKMDLQLDPSPDSAMGMWTVLIGRNGRGKTSILRAIALAAFGKSQASALAEDWLRSIPDRRLGGTAQTRIGAWFSFGARRPKSAAIPEQATGLVSWLGYTSGDSEFVGRRELNAQRADGQVPYEAWMADGARDVASPGLNNTNYRLNDSDARLGPPDDFIIEARRKNLDHLFVAAYGNTRRLYQPSSTKSRSGQSHRIASLFDPAFRITGLDFFENLGNGRAERFDALLQQALFSVADLMHEVTGLDLQKLSLDDSGVPDAIQADETYTATLDLPGGPIRIPTVWLADGQQALLSWLADLIGHLMLDQRRVTDPADFEGLVLVDDIDLHIHPDWQTRLIPALKRAFPRLQFIVTTHSPLIIASLRPEEVIELDLDPNGNVVANPLDVDPRLMTSTELYRRIFGVHETPPDPIFTDVKRYEFLCFTPYRTDEQETERKRLRRQLVAAGIKRIAKPVRREPLPPAP